MSLSTLGYCKIVSICTIKNDAMITYTSEAGYQEKLSV